MTSFGVPFGAHRPSHAVTVKPGTAASDSVGMLGASGQRFAVVTARPLSLPSRTSEYTLGMISIEQNAIIKIFSVAAVIFLPPTLVASIYGMNFDIIPELKWELGYPFAIGLMVISAILPFWYFRRRGWL